MEVECPMAKGGRLEKRVAAFHLLDSKKAIILPMSVIRSRIWTRVHESCDRLDSLETLLRFCLVSKVWRRFIDLIDKWFEH